ncbi:hypothetical protein B0J13DRAFT_537361 [Dactylonectria estremocensis]|uniref:Transmembrane protein n=1 Tax=Dactylonectria estremocensis TaxID=1079267 RepID=A0A9P9FJS1_9HYPO|nr:hypothetical protein B0J13DRAFT_537361 [Dactylonectria estremocensis]
MKGMHDHEASESRETHEPLKSSVEPHFSNLNKLQLQLHSFAALCFTISSCLLSCSTLSCNTDVVFLFVFFWACSTFWRYMSHSLFSSLNDPDQLSRTTSAENQQQEHGFRS